MFCPWKHIAQLCVSLTHHAVTLEWEICYNERCSQTFWKRYITLRANVGKHHFKDLENTLLTLHVNVANTESGETKRNNSGNNLFCGLTRLPGALKRHSWKILLKLASVVISFLITEWRQNSAVRVILIPKCIKLNVVKRVICVLFNV